MNNLHDQATPEEISTHLNDVVPKALANKSSYSNPDKDSLLEAITHPNFNRQHHDMVFNSFDNKDAVDNHSEVLGALADTPHFNEVHANKTISNIANIENPGRDVKDLVEKINQKYPNVDKSPFDQNILKQISDENVKPEDVENHDYANLNPEFLTGVLKSRPQFTLGPNLTPEQEADNKKAHKIDLLTLKNLASTKHTDKSLDETFNTFMDDKINNHSVSSYKGPHKSENTQSDLLSNLVNNQPGLTKDHLNQIYQKAEALGTEEGDDLKSNVISHTNVDPTLLSKVAREKNTGDWKKDQTIENALANPSLPHEVVNAIISDSDELGEKVHNLVNNKSLTKEQLNAIAEKGYHNEAMGHENSDPELHKKYWEKSDKSTAEARIFLGRENTPPEILKDIVNHENKNVAIDALSHKNADMSVIQEGLNRKAKDVQAAARKHPLVAENEMKKGFLEGKIKLSDILGKKTESEHFNKLSNEEKVQAYEKISDSLRGTKAEDIAKKTKEDPEKVFQLKLHLALDKNVPENIREKHSADIVDAFDQKTPHNSRDFDYGYHKPHKEMLKAFNKLLESGDKKAEKIALTKLGYIHDLGRKIDEKSNVSQEFLNQAFEKIANSENSTLVNSNGYIHNLSKQDVAEGLKDIVKIPKSSEENLKKYFDASANNSPESKYFNYGNTSRNGTILDSRYKDLPEEEKRQKYGQFLTPEHAFGVAASLDAPQDIKDKAFEMLSPEEKDLLVNDAGNEMEGFSPEILKNALLGKYDNQNENTASLERAKFNGASSYESHALGRLDPDNPAHTEVMDAYLTHHASKEGRKPADRVISDKIDNDWKTKHFDLFKKHANTHSYMYLDAVNQKLKEKTQKDLYKKTSPEEEKAKLSDSVNFLIDEAKHYASLSKSPGESGEATEEFWRNILEKYNPKDRYSSAGGIGKIIEAESGRSNGNLDFLADIGKKSATIKGLLLRKNILSPEKQNELENTFADFGEYLDSLPTSKRFASMNDKLSRWSEGEAPDKSQLMEIASRFDGIRTLTNDYADGSKTMSESVFNDADKNLKALYDQVSNTLKSPEKASEIVRRTFTSISKKDKEKLGNSLWQHIIDKPEDENVKAEKAISFYDGIERTAEVPSSILNKIANFASERNDINTLMSIFRRHENAPKSVSSKITKIVKESSNMEAGDIVTLSNLYGNEKFSSSNIKTLDSAFNLNINKALASGSITEEEAAEHRINYVENLHSVRVGSEDENKMKLVSSLLQKYATFPETRSMANRRLADYVSAGSTSLPITDKKHIYLSLPLDAISKNVELDRSLVNDPDIIENSTSGWKLNSLVNAMEDLNEDNLSTLVNRVVISEEADKGEVFAKLMKTSIAKKEDLRKLIRSIGDEGIEEYIQNASSRYSYNFMETHVHAILDHFSEQLLDLHDNPEKWSYEKNQKSHLLALDKKIEQLSYIFKKSTLTEDMGNPKETLSSYSNAINKISQASHTILDAIPENVSGQEAIGPNSILNSINDIGKAKIPFGGDDISNCFSVLKKLQSKYSPDAVPNKDIFDIQKSIVNKAENVKGEVWQTLASQHETYPFLLSGNNITKSMLDPINLQDNFNKHQDILAKEFTEWFKDMDSEALNAHGYKIINMVVDKVNSEKSEFIPLDLQNTINAGFQSGNSYLTSEQARNIYNKLPESFKLPVEKLCAINGTGGSEFISDIFKKHIGEDGRISQSGRIFLRSPAITDEMAEIALNSLSKEDLNEQDDILSRLVGNDYISEKYINKIGDKLLSGFEEKNKKSSHSSYNLELLQHAVKNPKISYEIAKKIFEKTNDNKPVIFENSTKFHPIFLNPTHGSRFLRDLPPESPKELEEYGISANKMVRDVLVEGKSREKIYDVIKNIPPEGIAWPEFKRKFPKYENIPEVKDIFMQKKNKPVVPEDFNQALAQSDEKDKFNSFHTTFSTWDGAQRHNKNQTNLVIQLNTSQKADIELSKDPKAWSLYQFILKHSNGIQNESLGSHPTTPHLISWSRVDVSNKGSWIIEEFQSDVAQKFRRNIKDLLRSSPSGLKLDGQNVTPEEIKKCLSKIDEAFSMWQKASMEAVLKNAKAHGIKKVYIHGLGIRSTMSGYGRVNGISGEYSKNHINPRLREIYDGTAEKYGFKKCEYKDYPNYKPELLRDTVKRGLRTYCWVLDIA